nr:(2Fe-2S)-binding protein [Achromobacter xylosoxidans]
MPVIAVDRQVCCHYFRRRDGDYCSTCPKLDLAERMTRIDAESAVPA